MWDMCVKDRNWLTIKNIYESSSTVVLLEGKNGIYLMLSKVWLKVVVYLPYYFQYSLMVD